MIVFRSFLNIFSGEVVLKILNISTIFILALLPNSTIIVKFALANSLIVLFFDTINNYLLHNCVNRERVFSVNFLLLLFLGFLYLVSYSILGELTLESFWVLGIAITYGSFSFIRSDLQLKGEFNKVALLSIVRSLPPFICAAVLYFFKSDSSLFFFSSLTIVNLALLGLLYKSLRNILNLSKFKFSKLNDIDRNILLYLFILSLFGQFDFLFFSQIYSEEFLAEVIILLRLVSIPAILLTAANSVIFPFIKHESGGSESKKIIFFIIFTTLCVSIAGYFLIPNIVPEGSIEMAISFGIITFFGIFSSLNLERSNTLLSLGNHSSFVVYFIYALFLKTIIICSLYIFNFTPIIIVALSLIVGTSIFNYLVWKNYESKNLAS